MRCLALLMLLSSTALAEPAQVTAEELAAAKKAKVSCKALSTALAADKAELWKAPKLVTAAVASCQAASWKLEAIVCTAREQFIVRCDHFLTEAQKEALETAFRKPDDMQQIRTRWVNIARRSGVLAPSEDAAPRPPRRKDDDSVPPLYDRLRDEGGAVPGLSGFALQRRPDSTRCGGVAITVVPGAKTDEPIAEAFALESPTGLDYSRHKVGASKRKLAAFRDDVERLRKATIQAYWDRTPRGTPAEYARIAQLHFRLASIVARAEIPIDQRTVAGARAFCDDAQDRAESLLAWAGEALAKCAKVLPAASNGWWTAVCTK
jgi:hypothetical protein